MATRPVRRPEMVQFWRSSNPRVTQGRRRNKGSFLHRRTTIGNRYCITVWTMMMLSAVIMITLSHVSMFHVFLFFHSHTKYTTIPLRASRLQNRTLLFTTTVIKYNTLLLIP